MNYLDILIVIPIIIGGWRGFKKGFIIEFFTLLALILGIYAGIHFSDFMTNILRDNLNLTTQYLPVIAFTITFLLVGAMVFFLGKVLERAIKVVALTPINKIAGLIFGAAKMLYLLSALLVILESIDEKNDFIPTEQKEGSLLYEVVKHTSLQTVPALKSSTLFLKSIE
ncbi:CvpA family protein [Paracrocinitomix mangrovi]|uniref:CvpA family protein n=1 Tax=Paracrocinitomix mangrovi TaxID=2862509 RepID=UPI001C8E7075|nr:CvpA family protein [Paracrocinitomix mangrovi]UKN01729.1 CvpA family protein [Paracrocinitomix mangrovi]